MWTVLRKHWPEYLIEAAGVGLLMVLLCFFRSLVEYPSSPIRQALPDPLVRRGLIGLAMGLTAISLVYSPWGKQSGAHFNPAVTLTFLRLGKVKPGDAMGYVTAQFGGGTLGALLSAFTFRSIVGHPAIHYAVTLPGAGGAGVAFLAEAGITFVLMWVILHVSNTPQMARYTGLFAGCLVAIYITVESPLSGMSMNPARSFSSAFAAHFWMALWIYFTAPPLGMLLAAEVYRLRYGAAAVRCAKLHHQNDTRCIFCGAHAQVK